MRLRTKGIIMKKIFFLFIVMCVVLPSRAQKRADEVIMVTGFPVQYVAYDELFVHQLKLGLDRNTSPMLEIKQNPSSGANGQKGDYYALRQLELESNRPIVPVYPEDQQFPALQVSTTTINADVALGYVDVLNLPFALEGTSKKVTLGTDAASPDALAIARFGRANITRVQNGGQLGLGVETLVVSNDDLLFGKMDVCGPGRVAQWITSGSSTTYLGCGNLSDEERNTKQWVRLPGLRQQGIADNKKLFRNYNNNPINNDWWEWKSDNTTPAEPECKKEDGTPLQPQPEQGAPCEFNGVCVLLRSCEIQDGCLYTTENKDPQVWEKWSCETVGAD